VITLALLHPLQSVAVQSWTFHDESSIKIGRATNNEVVLYSAVVSRHHVEIRKIGEEWEVVNLGSNGTYIDGKRVEQTKVVDGMIVRLATSGPKILIKIESTSNPERSDSAGEQSRTQRQPKGAKDTLIS
jgi:pSer/pThr/pTyr-binding forkhead associated (FHA) protein